MAAGLSHRQVSTDTDVDVLANKQSTGLPQFRFRRLSSASTTDSVDVSSPISSYGEDVDADLQPSEFQTLPKKVTLSKPKALELQSELLVEFMSPGFLKSMNTLARQYNGNTEDLGFRAAFTKLVRSRQMKVIPRYGYDASPEGVESMLRTFNDFDSDPDIYVNSVAIREALSVTKTGSKDSSPKPVVIKPHTPHRVCELLRALLLEFSMASFQHAVQDLKRKADLERGRAAVQSGEALPAQDPAGYYSLAGRGPLALQVYRLVLPWFGFEGTEDGVKEMIIHCAAYLGDAEVARLVDAVNLKLGMTKDACIRFHTLLANLESEA